MDEQFRHNIGHPEKGFQSKLSISQFKTYRTNGLGFMPVYAVVMKHTLV